MNHQEVGGGGLLSVYWDPALIALSFLVACLASFIALDTAGKVANIKGQMQWFWRIAGGMTMGLGIWSMHFIGMLAMKMPMMINYSITHTVLSLLLAIVASAVSLNVAVGSERLTSQRLIAATLILSCGVVSMHYIGMHAIMLYKGIHWYRPMVTLSVVIAFAASGAALWLAFHLRQGVKGVIVHRLLAALVMGIAISAMHYTGMAAATFTSVGHAMSGGISEEGLTAWVAGMTLSVLALMLVISLVESQLRALKLNESLKAMNDQLALIALHDPLTGLANRVQIDHKIKQFMLTSARTGRTFALMFMDLDGFKIINDAWGHHTGDQLLITVANRLKALLSPQMVLARLGGDEFVLLMPESDREEAERLASQMVNAIQLPIHQASFTLKVSLSIGISLYPLHGDTPHELKFNADTALYSVKDQGRNGWRVYSSGMGGNGKNQPELLQDLSLALDRNQFLLWYQPKYHNGTGEPAGFEALLRWYHPLQGLLLPERFLSLAEKTSLIIPVGNWVINEACRQLCQWHRMGRNNWTVSVNLSRMQFEHPELLTVLRQALHNHQIEPQKLTLEISETIIMHDLSHSIRVLNEISALCIRIAIDNFGCGFSDLLNMNKLPASELKINRAFILNAESSDRYVSLVSTLINVAQSMNMSVTAEGIETVEQHDLLTRLGCNSLQGHLMASPMPPEDIGKYLSGEPPRIITTQDTDAISA